MNSDIKVGTVAYFKTTGEPAFILEIKKGNTLQSFPELSGMVVTVRRPTQGRDGVRHNLDYYTLEEFETLQEQKNRQILEMEDLKSRFTDVPLQSPTDVFATN